MVEKITFNCSTEDLNEVILKLADTIKEGYAVQEFRRNSDELCYSQHPYHKPTFDVLLSKVGD